MRMLFALDRKDYAGCTHVHRRDSARAVIIRSGCTAMVYSRKYDYYKFPGGGLEPHESPVAALQRETMEESGLRIIPASIREYGFVHRIQRSMTDETECWVQDNYYYICDAEAAVRPQKLDGYEAEEGFTLVFADPLTVIHTNRRPKQTPYDPVMFEREARVLEYLRLEKYL
ncbi:MAG: NUDIX domain-containing protein [Solobacterium sp.]|nr:NUDIX domain-containing protein [Solobacterium sp.]MBR0214444.1 NUDIX domain-containing protein [Solobacterium sp.]